MKKKAGWVTMPSGRASSVWIANYGYVGLSAWPDGTWALRIRRCKDDDHRTIIRSEVPETDMDEAMRACEEMASRYGCAPLLPNP